MAPQEFRTQIPPILLDVPECLWGSVASFILQIASNLPHEQPPSIKPRLANAPCASLPRCRREKTDA